VSIRVHPCNPCLPCPVSGSSTRKNAEYAERSCALCLSVQSVSSVSSPRLQHTEEHGIRGKGLCLLSIRVHPCNPCLPCPAPDSSTRKNAEYAERSCALCLSVQSVSSVSSPRLQYTEEHGIHGKGLCLVSIRVHPCNPCLPCPAPDSSTRKNTEYTERDCALCLSVFIRAIRVFRVQPQTSVHGRTRNTRKGIASSVYPCSSVSSVSNTAFPPSLPSSEAPGLCLTHVIAPLRSLLRISRRNSALGPKLSSKPTSISVALR